MSVNELASELQEHLLSVVQITQEIVVSAVENEGAALLEAGSNVRVSTVNPYFMNTAGIFGPNPIYTQPVNASFLSDPDQNFNALITFLRQVATNALPPSMVGETYAQVLEMAEPERNVVVASPRQPFATQRNNALIEGELLAENRMSAVPFK